MNKIIINIFLLGFAKFFSVLIFGLNATYDPLNVTLQIGPVTVTGFSDEDIEVAFTDEEDVKQHVGIKGEHSYTENADKSGSITFSLKQDAKPTMQLLEILRLTKSSFPVLLQDISTGNEVKITTVDGRIQNRRNPKRGKETSFEQYIIACGTLIVADI